MRSLGLALSLSLFAAFSASATPCVALVHGLGRTPASMATIGQGLAAKGYVVVNEDYPSTRQTIEASAAAIGRDVAACRAKGAAPIDFVTHSQGAIVLRAYLQDHAIADAGRVVMLAPPNHGSEIVDHLRGHWWFDRATGPAGRELGTDAGSLPNRLGPATLPVGVIAGTRSHEPWFAGYFHGPNDGKVSVASARLDGMSDFITVDASHTFMMESRQVQDQVAAFLADGRFRR